MALAVKLPFVWFAMIVEPYSRDLRLPRRSFSVGGTSDSLHALAMLHYEIDALKQIDIAKHVAFYGDDIGVFPFAD